jgi:hypothetical protein
MTSPICIKRLAEKLGRPIGTLIALSHQNDPFSADTPAKRLQAEWFAATYAGFGDAIGVHLRRVHYRIISQEKPIDDYDGVPCINTDEFWDKLCKAAKFARYLKLVDVASFDDRRNPDPIIFLPEDAGEPNIDVKDFDIPAVPEPPELALYADEPPQKYHVELWCEKSSCQDELEIIARRYKLNVQLALGEISLTACHSLVQRAIASGRPVRILYLSDFDPAGQSMPVATARKIEWLIYSQNAELDVQLRPIVLNHEQCVRYRLPRTPIKAAERRAANFEERFDEGATELDALIALHPGELERIVEAEVLRYFDQTLAERFKEEANKTLRQLGAINSEVIAAHAAEIRSLQRRYAKLNEEAEGLFDQISEELEERAKDVPLPVVEAKTLSQPQLRNPAPRSPKPRRHGLRLRPLRLNRFEQRLT